MFPPSADNTHGTENSWPQGRSLVNSTTRPSDQDLRVLLLLPQQLVHREATRWTVTPRVRVYLLGQDHCRERAPVHVGWPELVSGSSEEGQCWRGRQRDEGKGLALGLAEDSATASYSWARASCSSDGSNRSETRSSLQWEFLRPFQTAANYQAKWWDSPTEFFNFKGISANL